MAGGWGREQIKRGAKGLRLPPLRPRPRLPPAPRVHPPPPSRTLGRSSLRSLDRHALTPWGWIFLLLSKWNRAGTRSCNTDLSKSCNTVGSRPESYNTVCPRPESCDTPRALMSVTPNLCCDETELRGIHSSDIIKTCLESSTLYNTFIVPSFNVS